MLQRRPNTFAQTILSLSFSACDKAADHTYRLARHSDKEPSWSSRPTVLELDSSCCRRVGVELSNLPFSQPILKMPFGIAPESR